MVRKTKDMINWFIRGKDGRIHLFQLPNIPIAGWFVSMIVATFFATGATRTGFSNLSLAFLAIWSYLEITRGLSYFRRTLGVVVAVLTVYYLFQ